MTTSAPNLPHQAASIWPGGVAAIRSGSGPWSYPYAVPADCPRIFKWAPGSTLADDGTNTTAVVIAPTGTGNPGAYIALRENDQGAALTDASVTITIGFGRWRTLPVNTLSNNRILTLGTTNAAAGDWIEVTRLDVNSYTYAIANGGIGGGTLVTMPVASRAFAKLYFDGTNWVLRDSHLML